MERPNLADYEDEIHHPNGTIEDCWRHNEYVEDLEKYVDYLEQLALYKVVKQSEQFYCKSSTEDDRQLRCVHPCGSNGKCKFKQ